MLGIIKIMVNNYTQCFDLSEDVMKIYLISARVWFFLGLLFFLTACAPRQPGMIRDIEVLPQDARHYVDDPEELFISADKQD
jgi:hypothetical protein